MATKQDDMKVSVIPTILDDGSVRIDMTTDEYSGWVDFIQNGGAYVAYTAIKDGIKRGRFTDIRLIDFFNSHERMKKLRVDFQVKRSDGTDLVDDRDGKQMPKFVDYDIGRSMH